MSSLPDRSGERRQRRLATAGMSSPSSSSVSDPVQQQPMTLSSSELDDDDLRGAGGILGGHWRRWRRALLGRSSSAPTSAAAALLHGQDLGDFTAKFPQMKDVLQVYPKDTPLALFTSLVPEDVDLAVPEESGAAELLRQRVLRAVETARQWVRLQELDGGLQTGSGPPPSPSSLMSCGARRSLDVDSAGSGGSGGSTSPLSSTTSASSSLAASMLLLRPRAFARQLSDDLRRRRESYAAGQSSVTSGGGGCFSPLATSAGLPQHLHHHQHRHSVGGIQLASTGGLLPPPHHQQQQRLHSVAVATANYATGGASGIGEGGNNLQRIRNSALGQSAPSLTASNTHMRDFMVSRRSSRVQPPTQPAGAHHAQHQQHHHHQQQQHHRHYGGAHHHHHRKSMIAATSPTLPPRCHSPLSQGSPMESPRNMSPSQQFAFVPLKKAECRRWSVASLPSSGYGTTPASSNVSSQCSSQERLNHLPTVPTAEEMRYFSRHVFSSGESQPGSSGISSAAAGGGKAVSTEETDGCCAAAAGQTATTPSTGRRSPRMRPRSRSLSSPIRSPVVDNEVVMMNMLYKERFPKATQQMEERLKAFIDENSVVDALESGSSTDGGSVSTISASAAATAADIPADAIAIVRFVQHQVVELARDCLQKSEQRLITSRYFYDMSDNVERLLTEAKDKSVDAIPYLSRLVRKLLLIISRPARLLECLEFDPEEFYHMLEEAEGQVRITEGVTDFPQYIVTQLGLNRDPLAEFQQDLNQLEKNCSTPEPSEQQQLESGAGECTPTGAGPSGQGTETMTTSTPEKKPDLPKESDYEVIKLISNGAYGAVHLVRHRETRQRFAMKKINKRNLLLRNQIEQAFAERDILCFTDNPFVVSLQCSFETQRHLCMVMEYVEGGDCATLLKNMGPFPCDMARLYFAEMVLAVEYLHSYGIVHRDLKPDNLLITSMGHIKLTDFGLSKMGLMSLATNLYEGFIDRETREFSDKQVFGTPEYIAPEVVLRQGYGKPVDWWASGIILYEFLIGCVPFFGETPEELFAHVVNDDIEWPSDDDWPVPAEAKDLITALLQQNPRDRLGTGGIGGGSGAADVKAHPFFGGLDWNSLLRQKVGFVPQLNDEHDTSYFDTRADRYCHDDASAAELDLDGECPSPSAQLFGSFSSCSPRYKKSHGLFLMDSNNKSSNDSVSGHSDFSDQSASCNSSTAGDLPMLPTSASNSNAPGNGSGLQHQGTPESTTTTEADEDSTSSSPQLQRRRRMLHRELKSLPRFSISMEESGRCLTPVATPDHIRELSPVDEGDRSGAGETPPQSAVVQHGAGGGARPKNPLLQSLSPNFKQRTSSRSHQVMKSSSLTSGLSLVIPPESGGNSSSGSGLAAMHHLLMAQSPGGGSSTASSRDTSPCRELSPTITPGSLKPPIVLRRAPRGFGFTLRAIRVYLGDSDFYTVHHLVMAVDDASPAMEAGLRPGDLITHINGEPIQGLFHTQVLQLILSEGDRVTLRATPLDQTSIQTGGRKREPAKSRLARRGHRISHVIGHPRRPPGGKGGKGCSGAGGSGSGNDSHAERRRKSSLFRRLSSKRASAEIQQLAASVVGGASSPTVLTPSRSFQSLKGFLPANYQQQQDNSGSNSPGSRSSGCSPPILRHCRVLSPSESPRSTPSSSPGSSAPNSPASGNVQQHFSGGGGGGTAAPHRPSSLHGLKNKLHSVAKNMHSPSRRKSAGHVPLSPLARTPSPSPQPQLGSAAAAAGGSANSSVSGHLVGPVSPTRSPSPLAFPLHQVHHPPGSSHSVQLFSPGASLSVSPAAKQRSSLSTSSSASSSASSSTVVGHRPRSAEPGSPLLRRALSPDRLHPRSAEKNCIAISPLCSDNNVNSGNSGGNGPLPKVTVITPPLVTILSQATPESTETLTGAGQKDATKETSEAKQESVSADPQVTADPVLDETKKAAEVAHDSKVSMKPQVDAAPISTTDGDNGKKDGGPAPSSPPSHL